MAESLYNVNIELPFVGKVAGTLAIRQGESGAVATVTALGSTMDLECTVQDGRMTAGGDVKLPLGINRFDVDAALSPAGIDGVVQTNKGSFPFRGDIAQ